MTLFSFKAEAADIQVAEWKGEPVITIGGEFVSGDAFDFIQIAMLSPGIKTVVLLDSPGGTVEQFGIAEYIHDNGFHVIVAEDAECTSYCAFIAVSDKDYEMEPGSTLLFHSIYIPPHYLVDLIEEGYCNDDNTECGIPYEHEGIVVGLEVMNREAIRDMMVYLFKIGMSQEFILSILDNGPDSFYQITAD